MNNQERLRKSTIIRASEIGQFIFCPVSWYLQRCGYNPDSPSLEAGRKVHEHLGITIESLTTKTRRSSRLALIGVLLFLCACVLLILGVFF